MEKIEGILQDEQLSVEGYQKRMQFFRFVEKILKDNMGNDYHSLRVTNYFLLAQTHIRALEKYLDWKHQNK